MSMNLSIYTQFLYAESDHLSIPVLSALSEADKSLFQPFSWRAFELKRHALQTLLKFSTNVHIIQARGCAETWHKTCLCDMQCMLVQGVF